MLKKQAFKKIQCHKNGIEILLIMKYLLIPKHLHIDKKKNQINISCPYYTDKSAVIPIIMFVRF